MPKNSDKELAKLRKENESQRQTIAELNKKVDSLIAQIAELQNQLKESLNGNTELKERLDALLIQLQNSKRREHGPTTERHNPRQAPPEPDDDESDDTEFSDSANKPKKEKRPRNHKKHIKDQNVPTTPVNHLTTDEERICPHCNVETVFVDHEVTYQLERLLQSLVRLEHKQEIRACPKCKEYIVTAEKPCPPIPGGYAGPCLLSSIIVDKFADALPNYRQTKRFLREDGIIPRQTQCDWVIASSLLLEPLYEVLKREVLKSKVIQTDDSWIKIQDRKLKKKMRKGKLTVYRGDKNHPSIFFDFSPDLSFDRNKAILNEFQGFVQADAANGFDVLFEENSGKTEIGCNSHSRRRYWQCNDAYELICNEILDLYHELYKVEKDILDKGAPERLAARQDKSKPLTENLHQILLNLKDELNPSNPLMKAVNYTLNHWVALTRFLDDPDFEIDNNASERAIKAFVLVRKNSLFVGSDAGGKAAAIHLSFISTCNQLGIDPLEYLTDVFTRINSMKTSELEQLLPDRWAKLKQTNSSTDSSNKSPP